MAELRGRRDLTLPRRYLAHTVVLIIAIALSGFGTVQRHLGSSGLRLGALSAEALVVTQGGEVGDVSLGRLSTIIKPISVPTASQVPHEPVQYTVGEGEDLRTIANKHNLTLNEIRWSNGPLTKTDRVSAGDHLVLPPVSGLVVTVKAEDSVAKLADAYHVDSRSITEFNYLRDPEHLLPGTQLVIPAGRGPELFPRIASNEPPHMGPYPKDKFAYGYCTWYVASRRPVPWTGNAWEWYGGARALHFPTSDQWVPQPGAIMVTWESWVGHVAYVEKVYADGSIEVSEMNYKGWGVLSTRTIRPKQVPLIGFIYDAER